MWHSLIHILSHDSSALQAGFEWERMKQISTPFWLSLYRSVAKILATGLYYVETRIFTYVDSVRYPPTYIPLESWDCPRDNYGISLLVLREVIMINKAESYSFFLKRRTRLSTDSLARKLNLHTYSYVDSYEMSFAGGVFLLPPFFEFSSLSLSFSKRT